MKKKPGVSVDPESNTITINVPEAGADQPALIEERDVAIKKGIMLGKPLRHAQSWISNGEWALHVNRIANPEILTCDTCRAEKTGWADEPQWLDEYHLRQAFPGDVTEFKRSEQVLVQKGRDYVMYVGSGGEIAFVLRDYIDHFRLDRIYGEASGDGPMLNCEDAAEATLVLKAMAKEPVPKAGYTGYRLTDPELDLEAAE
jgi:hypothetical protein